MPYVLRSPLLVLGHRGAISGHFGFQQNSLKAFQEAVDGGDGFETDAVVDKDGEIFLIHEAKYVDSGKGVEYCAGEYMDDASAALLGSRRIDQVSTTEIRQLRLKDGAPLPTLKQAIELIAARGKLIDIELKAHDITRHVLGIVKDYLQKGIVTPQSFVISSFNLPALEIVRREVPDIAVGAIFIGADQAPAPIFPWRPGSAGVYTPLTPEALQDPMLKKVQPDYIIMPDYVLTRATVDMVAGYYPKTKLAAWVFTEKGGFDLPEFMERFKDLASTRKIGAVIVDNPREFMKVLQG